MLITFYVAAAIAIACHGLDDHSAQRRACAVVSGGLAAGRGDGLLRSGRAVRGGFGGDHLRRGDHGPFHFRDDDAQSRRPRDADGTSVAESGGLGRSRDTGRASC